MHITDVKVGKAVLIGKDVFNDITGGLRAARKYIELFLSLIVA